MPKNRLSCLAVCLLLASCSGGRNPVDLQVSGAKMAAATAHLLVVEVTDLSKPSAMLGIFAALFTGQGIFLPVQGAILGYETQKMILEGMSEPITDENFSVLMEVGNVLQVNVIDLLNRSDNRSETLLSYIQSLRNTTVLLERKITEVSTLVDELKAKEKEQKTIVRDLERKEKAALKAQDYGTAASVQQELQGAESSLTETQVKREQAQDMLARFEDLYQIAAVRLQAIEVNREILIAGLKVVEVPGIEDLGILEQGRSYRRRSGAGSDSIFGSPR